jgi:cytochrome c
MTEMAAHPQINDADATKMVEYILSLGDAKAAKNLPLAGTVVAGKEQDGVYVLTATYKDKSISNLPSLEATDALILRSSFLRANDIDQVQIARKNDFQGNISLENILNGASAVFKNIDLTGIKTVTMMAYINPKATLIGGEAEIHLDKTDGPLLGSVKVSTSGASSVSIKIPTTTGYHDLVIVFKNSTVKDKPMFTFGGLRLENK